MHAMQGIIGRKDSGHPTSNVTLSDLERRETGRVRRVTAGHAPTFHDRRPRFDESGRLLASEQSFELDPRDLAAWRAFWAGFKEILIASSLA
jgi:hypothetical protein